MWLSDMSPWLSSRILRSSGRPCYKLEYENSCIIFAVHWFRKRGKEKTCRMFDCDMSPLWEWQVYPRNWEHLDKHRAMSQVLRLMQSTSAGSACLTSVIEAIRSTHWNVKSEFWGYIEVGMWMSLSTQLTQQSDWFQLFNEHHVLHCVFWDCELRIANLFLVIFSAFSNEWFVTRHSRSSPE